MTENDVKWSNQITKEAEEKLFSFQPGFTINLQVWTVGGARGSELETLNLPW